MYITKSSFYSELGKKGYTDKDIDHLFERVKESDPETRKWIINWLQDGIYPSAAVEGITVEFLTEKLLFTPMNAFLIMDWLKHDPVEAKYYLTHPDISILPVGDAPVQANLIFETHKPKD